jgi:hypothetical protein
LRQVTEYSSYANVAWMNIRHIQIANDWIFVLFNSLVTEYSSYAVFTAHMTGHKGHFVNMRRNIQSRRKWHMLNMQSRTYEYSVKHIEYSVTHIEYSVMHIEYSVMHKEYSVPSNEYYFRLAGITDISTIVRGVFAFSRNSHGKLFLFVDSGGQSRE